MSGVGELTKEIVRLQIYLFVLKELKSDLAIRVNYGSVPKPSFHQIHKTPLCLCLPLVFGGDECFFSLCLLMGSLRLMQRLAPKYKIVSCTAIAQGFEERSAFRLYFNCCSCNPEMLNVFFNADMG